jgi:hypothetical protein
MIKNQLMIFSSKTDRLKIHQPAIYPHLSSVASRHPNKIKPKNRLKPLLIHPAPA